MVMEFINKERATMLDIIATTLALLMVGLAIVLFGLIVGFVADVATYYIMQWHKRK